MSAYNTLKIQQVATVRSGYSFRGSIYDYGEGKVPLLTSKQISSFGTVDDLSSLMLDIKITNSDSFASNNDIVFSNKGVFKAGVVSSKRKLLPSSSLAVISINEEYMNKVSPHYIAMVLNSKKIQKQIFGSQTGATLPKLTIKEISELEITIPPIDVQQHLIQLKATIEEESKYLKLKQNILTGIYNQTINSIIN